MFNTQKQKEDSYKKKIQELHTELESVTLQLASVCEKRDVLGCKNENLVLENNKLSEIINKRKLEIEILDKQIEERKISYKKLVDEYSDYREKEEAGLDMFLNIKNTIQNNIRDLEEKEKVLSKVKPEVVNAMAKIMCLSEESKKIDINNREKSILLNAKEKELSEKEKELYTLVEKNGRILTGTEYNLRTIEHYVRRLQRYYDETGLNIHILEQFNIKKDTK